MPWWSPRARPSWAPLPLAAALAALAAGAFALPVQAQAPMGVHLTLGATLADGDMSPPDVSHLVVQWSTLTPYGPAQSPQVLWSLEGGPERAAPAFLSGVARDTSPTNELEAQPQYAARLAPVPRGATVTYRVGEPSLGYAGPFEARMVPDEGSAVRIAAVSHVGYDGYDRVTRQRIAGADAPAERMAAAAKQLDPDLVLLPGHIALSTSLRPWDIALGMLQPLAATVPVMAVPGPEEADADHHHLRERFVLPLVEDGRVADPATYTLADDAAQADDVELLHHGFSAGPVYVVGLSATTLCKPFTPYLPVGGRPVVGIPPCEVGQLDPTQATWLHDVLEDAREDLHARWIVAYVDGSPYMHADDGADALVLQHFVPLLEQYGVDLVLSGSEAIYQRSWPLQRGQPAVAGAGNDLRWGAGTVYVNTGGGGASPAEPIPLPAPSWLAAQAEGHHTVTVDADRATLTVTARDANGTVLDTMTLHRPESPGYAAADGPAGTAAQAAPADVPGPALAAAAAGLALATLARRRRA